MSHVTYMRLQHLKKKIKWTSINVKNLSVTTHTVYKHGRLLKLFKLKRKKIIGIELLTIKSISVFFPFHSLFFSTAAAHMWRSDFQNFVTKYHTNNFFFDHSQIEKRIRNFEPFILESMYIKKWNSLDAQLNYRTVYWKTPKKSHNKCIRRQGKNYLKKKILKSQKIFITINMHIILQSRKKWARIGLKTELFALYVHVFCIKCKCVSHTYHLLLYKFKNIKCYHFQWFNSGKCFFSKNWFYHSCQYIFFFSINFQPIEF